MPEMKLSDSRVLVTGGAGFIGSNLCEDLLRYGNRIVCFDNFATGRRENIAHLLPHENFQLYEGDIRNSDDCAGAMRNIDVVLQQAALGSVPRSIHDPETTNAVNISGFLNVLTAARDAKVKRFVYASSSSVYGDLTDSPKVEERTGRPLSPYAVTKIANEQYAHVFGINYGMEIIGLRYFNVFGPRQDPESAYAAAVPRFIKALIEHRSPVIFGDGKSSRDFTYVKNVIRMNHLAATTLNKAAIGKVFNTATGTSATLNELVAKMKALLSKKDPGIMNVSSVFMPLRKGDILHSLASVERAAEMLGYAPSHYIEEGLAETVAWFEAGGS